MTKKPKVAGAGRTPITPVSAKELKELGKRVKQRYEALRRKYPEVHGKVVDFISHTIQDGTLYISVRFKDKTEFSLRYACHMFLAGADICDVKTGNFEIIREYMKPIPR